MKKKRMLAAALWLTGGLSLLGQQAGRFTYQGLDPEDRQAVEALLGSMSLEEKVGQLFVPAVALHTPGEIERALYLIDSCRIGGVSLYRNTPGQVADFINRAQARSRIPLFTAMTLERGLAMRLDGAFAYPWPLTLGAVQDDSLVYRVGRRIGAACREMGINYNFAPAADVNTDARNPIIGVRSFGSRAPRVAEKVTAFVRGLQDEGILASVKHFPGHGATVADSHKELPLLPFSARRLEQVELLPFEKACRAGVASVMTGHLYVPAFDSTAHTPSSLSERIVGGILRRAWGYRGLVVTDALNMKGVSDRYGSPQAEIRALQAGNDLLLYSQDPETGYRGVLEAVRRGEITPQRIDSSVRRILAAKWAAGLSEERWRNPVGEAGFRAAAGNERDSALCLSVMEHAVTLLHNRAHSLPLADAADTVYYLPLGRGDYGYMTRYLAMYAPVAVLPREASAAQAAQAAQRGRLVVGYHGADDTSFTPGKVSPRDIERMDSLAAAPDAALVVLDNPYVLLQFDAWRRYPAALLAYQNMWAAQWAAAEAIGGAIAPRGKLPVDLDGEYRAGHGETFRPIGRLSFGFPSQAGIDRSRLAPVDSLLADIVSSGAAPGGRLLVARGGRVVIDECFGTTMYDDTLSRAVTPGTVYDLASVTKVSATLPLVITLFDKGKVSFSSRLGEMVPAYRGSNKAQITLKELLTHNGGLPAGLPFHSYTVDKQTKELSDYFYSGVADDEHPLEVGQGLYMRACYPDTVTARIRKCPLKPKRLLYSDLDFYLLRQVVDRFYPQGIERAAREKVFLPLGAYTMGYRPLERMPADSIAPTVKDTWFRHQTVCGHVHDSGAALMGGVSGHAGNFGTAYDLAKYGQMLLQKGYYGGHRFFSPATLERFTCYAYGTAANSRSAGFVKKQIGSAPDDYDGFLSDRAYWHTGFTGTLLLVEPAEDLVYVLLTNRTYAEKKSGLFTDRGYRFAILKTILDAIERPQDASSGKGGAASF